MTIAAESGAEDAATSKVARRAAETCFQTVAVDQQYLNLVKARPADGECGKVSACWNADNLRRYRGTAM